MTAPDRIWAWAWHLPGSRFHNTHAWSSFKPFWPDSSEFNFRKMRWEKVPQKQQDFNEYARVAPGTVTLPRAEVEALVDAAQYLIGENTNHIAVSIHGNPHTIKEFKP